MRYTLSHNELYPHAECAQTDYILMTQLSSYSISRLVYSLLLFNSPSLSLSLSTTLTLSPILLYDIIYASTLRLRYVYSFTFMFTPLTKCYIWNTKWSCDAKITQALVPLVTLKRIQSLKSTVRNKKMYCVVFLRIRNMWVMNIVFVLMVRDIR